MDSYSSSAEDVAQIVRRLQPLYQSSTRSEHTFARTILTDVAQYAESYLIKINRMDEVEIEASGDESVSLVCSPFDLRTVLFNFVQNSIDAIEGAGKIQLACREDESAIHIEVRDNGRGMSPEVKRKCFEAFYSTKPKRGSGLGLSTARTLINSYGGRLSVESTPGEGATFSITLPKNWKANPASRNDEQPFRSLRVLLVADDAGTLQSIKMLLESMEQHVTETTSPDEAIALLDLHEFDVLLTDYDMPEPSGAKLCEWVRTQDATITLVVMSGAKPPRLSDICNLVIDKPISASSLQHMLEVISHPSNT